MLKTNCRLCSSNNLKLFLDLGMHPPSDQFIKLKKINQQTIFYPLKGNELYEMWIQTTKLCC